MENPSAPIAETRHGTLLGTLDDDCLTWRGIPYAAPPRWSTTLAGATAASALAGDPRC